MKFSKSSKPLMQRIRGIGAIGVICGCIIQASSTFGVAQESSRFDGLENYLNQQMVGPDPVRIIKSHLVESGTGTPLDELVAWAKAGFPDLQENGYWKTEAISLKLGIVRSIHYYFETAPPRDKSKRYLEILEELEKDDYISYHLVGMASVVVDEALLERTVIDLLEQKDPTLRAKGVEMGARLAEKKRDLFDRYHEMLNTDDNPRVRMLILHAFIGWKTREVALIALDRLLNDTDASVRERGSRGLEMASERPDQLSVDDLILLLPPMLRTNDSMVRKSLGLAAARLSTPNRQLYVRSEKITDEFLFGYINSVRLKGTEGGSPLNNAELAKEWLAWWTPLIPAYTGRIQIVH